MADSFDPYHKWLGIADPERPPNHYRLLGLDVFESDAEVIEGAADRQMAHLRNLSGGSHSATAQRLLNEVSAARVCLLNTEKKARYDAALRTTADAVSVSSSGVQRAQPLPPAMGVARAAPVPAAGIQTMARPAAPALKVRGGGRSASRRGNPWVVPLVATGAVLAIVGIAIAVIVLALPSAEEPSVAQVPNPGNTTDGDSGSTAKTSNSAVDPALVKSSNPIGTKSGGNSTALPKVGTGGEPVGGSKTIERAGKPVDLLKLIKLDLHKWKGDWTSKGTAIVAPPGSYASVIVPYKLPEEYVVELDVTRRLGQGSLALVLVRDGRPFAIYIDSLVRGGRVVTGISRLDGRRAHNNETTINRRILFRNQPSKVVVEVTKAGIRLQCDGRELFHWQGDSSRLSLSPNWKSDSWPPAMQGLMVVGNYYAVGMEISRIELLPISGQGKWVEIVASDVPEPGVTRATVAGVPPVPLRQVASSRAKLPVPDAAAQKKSEDEVRGIFKDDFAASQPTAKYDLAKKLFQAAKGTNDSPVARFVLFRLAGDLAASVGDATGPLEAVDALDKDYQIDPWKMSVDWLVQAGKSTLSNDQRKATARKQESLADKAMKENRYEQAEELYGAAVLLAGRIRDSRWAKQLADDRRNALRLSREYEKVKVALATLKTNPGDAASHQTVGEHLCLNENEWSPGLHHLALGTDAALKSLAQREMKPPTDAKGQLALAEAWQDFAASSRTPWDQGALVAAEFWYRRALAGLISLDKIKAEKELERIGRVPDRRRDLVRPEDAPGAADSGAADGDTARFTAPARIEKLQPINQGDGQFSATTSGGVPALQAQGQYIYVGVDDAFAHEVPVDTRDQYVLRVTVLDSDGELDVQYDGHPVADDASGRLRSTESFDLEGSGDWITLEATLDRPKLANRQDHGADLRLRLQQAGGKPLVVKSIELVRRPDALEPLEPDEDDDQSPPPAGDTLTLLEPAEGAMLSGQKGGVWQFRWSPVEGATAYEIFVKHPAARIPVLQTTTAETSHRLTLNGGIRSDSRQGWEWRVRPIVDGTPGEWSATQTFDASGQ